MTIQNTLLEGRGVYKIQWIQDDHGLTGQIMAVEFTNSISDNKHHSLVG